MRYRDTALALCRAPRPARRMFFLHLAHAVAVARRPAGVVIEATSVDPTPRAIVRPAWILEDLLASSRGSFEPVEGGPTPASPSPPPGAFVRGGVIVPRSRPERERSDELPPTGRPFEPLLGPGGWVAFQTFWVGGLPGSLWVARRFRYAAPSRSALRTRFDRVAAAFARDWGSATQGAAGVRPSGVWGSRGWRFRTTGDLPRGAWVERGPGAVASTAEVPAGWWGASNAEPPSGHTVVFGSSGAGKTTFLAHRAAEAIGRGERVLVIDLHGDLTPAIVARLSRETRGRVLAVDASDRPVPGIAALSGHGDDRAAGLLVAAVKRLSADGGDVYWGFRLERIFDTFVRLVQESGGSLLDLYGLLTNEDRRDVARLATRRPELARFLEELGPVVRRNPDYLWPAATRLSKVALLPALRELLAPADGGLPVEELVAEGRSILVRLPFARLGPEAASLAGTFVLARMFLGLAGRDGELPPRGPVLLVLDEVQGFSARLVAEVLAESRKFGVRAVVATQYPERLVPEVRHAAAGASTQCVVFRVPPPSAAEAGSWLGLDPRVAERTLPLLPPGQAVELDPDTGGLRRLAPVPEEASTGADAWAQAVSATRREFVTESTGESNEEPDDPALERLLLAVLAAEEERSPLSDEQAVRAALALPGLPLDAAVLADRWRSVQRTNWLRWSDGRCFLAPAGARWLGLGSPTLAPRETAEHRRLLLRAFRVFARHGCRLEILRQGRFDTTLPDALFRQLPRSAASGSPGDLARTIDRARRTWGWRFFGGRDVHVEAEVSGALRPERIRHGWAKGAERGAFVLFLVGDPVRARKVRGTLAREKVARDRAQVWTLRDSAAPNA